MQSKWIKCSDRMPEEEGYYLTWDGYSRRIFWFEKGEFRYPFSPTHWMPLPDGPNVP